MKSIFSVLLIASVCIVSMSAVPQDDELSKSIARGKTVYETVCITCHLADGKGIPSVFPPLAGSDYLLTNREAAIRAVKLGMEGEITVNGITYNNFMAPPGLSDTEVADVMNYILNSWGNKGERVTVTEVNNIK